MLIQTFLENIKVPYYVLYATLLLIFKLKLFKNIIDIFGINLTSALDIFYV